MELNPGFTHLPSVQHTEKRGRCSDCNRGTGLLWSSQGVQDYRLCQSCAKRRGPPYSTAIRIHLGGKWLKPNGPTFPERSLGQLRDDPKANPY